jgi:hypothetical protein
MEAALQSLQHDLEASRSNTSAEIQSLRSSITSIQEQLVSISNSINNVVPTASTSTVTTSNIAPTPAPAPSGTKEPKISAPEHFNGDRAKTRYFLAQVHLVFVMQANRFPSDGTKTGYIASLLRGPAAAWVTPLIERNDPIMHDYNQFLAAFKQSFSHPDLAAEASRKLRALKQGSRPVAVYAAEFRRIASDLDWSSSSLMDAFYAGLLDRVKDRLSEVERPTTGNALEAYIQLAIKIDDRQFQRLQEKRFTPAPKPPTRPAARPQSHSSPTDNGVVPMQLDSARRMPLTPDERKRRQDNNLCLYCGGSNHRIANCPEARQSRTTRANAASSSSSSTTTQPANFRKPPAGTSDA